jgi:hypothetical protein
MRIRRRIAGLACGLVLIGCTPAREQTSTVTAASMRADEQPSEERQPEGWPPYYPPRLVRDMAGTDAVTGEAASIERGYVLHRLDLEKVRVLDARAARCDQDLGICEERVASMAAPSDFWDGSAGRALLIGIGFLAGVGVTASLAVALD